MLNCNEDALVCDLAETYQIYDYRQLPVLTVAVFACGLKNDSRIKMALNQQTVPVNTQLLAGIYDVVNLLAWSKTKDAQKGVKRPSSVVDAIMGASKSTKDNDAVIFNSGEDFERVRQKIMKGDV